MIAYTNADSKTERGDEEEAMKTYILVRRRTDDEVNKVVSMKAHWYQGGGIYGRQILPFGL
jgi:hypothetical protein